MPSGLDYVRRTVQPLVDESVYKYSLKQEFRFLPPEEKIKLIKDKFNLYHGKGKRKRKKKWKEIISEWMILYLKRLLLNMAKLTS